MQNIRVLILRHDLVKTDKHTHFLELQWCGHHLIIGTVSKILHELLKWLQKDKYKKLWERFIGHIHVHAQV